jgi:alkanesulfonate monooxygenase SsuD/methylene tetrahydromethanopterin reductase-like flavin-dependent oxidoreductase (luciferase family)
MRYGIEVVPFGAYSDPREVVRLAQAAEAAGWEALALWDHVNFPYEAGDPWVTLAAVAAATRRLKLITAVAPLPRYRPHLLARTLAALDILSEGRMVFGTGLGVAFDLAPFGDPTNAPTLAAALRHQPLKVRPQHLDHGRGHRQRSLARLGLGAVADQVLPDTLG